MTAARATVRTTLVAALLTALAFLGWPAPAQAGPATAGSERRADNEITRVVVISVDGLNPTALTKLGKAGTPAFHRLMAEGAYTLNARSEVELTLTLPNHTGMVTSRRIDRTKGGHGVTWNDDRLVPRTVQAAAGRPVGSVFSALKKSGHTSAMFAAKTKFSLFNRSWPNGIQRTVITEDNQALVKRARQDLRTTWRDFTFLHISLPDVAGHAHGWMSPAYLTAVRQSDALVGKVMTTIAKTADSREHTLLVVTADHGGIGPTHSDPTLLANYRIPFLAWGPGVPAATDLYSLNPTYADPGKRRVGYAAPRQPIRNGDIGNLVLDVLGLPPIPKSELDYAQDLELG